MNFLERLALSRAEEQMHTPKSYKAREGKRRGPTATCPLCDEALGGLIVTFQGRRVHKRCVEAAPVADDHFTTKEEKVDGYDLDA